MPSMLWHKCLVKVLLPLYGVVNIIDGVKAIPTALNSRALSTMPLLLILLVVDALIVIALGVFAFVLRRRLDDGRENAPHQLFLFYMLNCLPRLMTLLAVAMLDRTFGSWTFLSGAIGFGFALFMAILNHIYYKKRAWLFDC